MTKAEKYFVDEDIIDQFAYELSNYMFDNLGWYEGDVYNLKKTIECFLKSNFKPKLTEDERAILSKVKSEYKYIGRKNFLSTVFLYVSCKEKCDDFVTLTPFDQLFQFIKERRRILY